MSDLFSTTNQEVEIVSPETEPSESEVEQIEEPTEEVEEPKDEFKDWNKEKSVNAYRELQRKVQEREELAKENERKVLEEREARIRLEEQLKLLQGTQQSQPEAKEPPVPQRPKKPANYRELDPYDSEKIAYDNDYQEYLEAKDVRKDWEDAQLKTSFKTLEEERENNRIATERAKAKANSVFKLQQITQDSEKAAKVYDFVEEWYKKDEMSLYVELYDLKMSQDPNKELKSKQALQRSQRQSQIASPATLSNEAELQNESKGTPVQADHSNLFITK